MTVYATSAEMLGLRIGRKASPRIICLETASGFADISQVRATLFKRGVSDAEQLNSGIHGHLYARPGETLVVQAAHWSDCDPSRLAPHLLKLNADIWRLQTGIELLTTENGRLSLVQPGKSMLAHGVALIDEPRNGNLVASCVTFRLAELLSASDGPIAELAEACEALNRKNTCISLLSDAGLPVPASLPFEAADVDEEAIDQITASLPAERSYVVKADGSCGGIGVYLNGEKGYSVDELRELLIDLKRSSQLPNHFLVQEFVPGATMGACAWIDDESRVHLTSVHRQGVHNGSCEAGYWSRSEHERLKATVTQMYQKLVRLPLRLRGPIGLDFQLSNSGPVIIECNARLTGCGPIGYVWSLLGNEAAHLAGSGQEPLRIETIDLFMDVASPGVSKLGDDRLLRLIGEIIADPRVRASCPGPPMILPQGLDPFKTVKVLFVNDPQGVAKKAFFSEFPRNK